MIAIIDYKAGNLTSVKLAFDALGVPVEITSSPDRVLEAERVVFPGVGAAGSAMKSLNDGGLSDAIRKVAAAGRPFLGICLGCQIIFDKSEENNVSCLGVLPGSVCKFQPANPRDKVPQMGWNSVSFTKKDHPLFAGIKDQSEFYFVHSYYPVPADRKYVLGETEYAGVRFASIMGYDNVAAMQFHPEKSGRIGLKLLSNFVKWNGKV
jgi:imidazole glycerol-phosphate synthase subunit HisH